MNFTVQNSDLTELETNLSDYKMVKRLDKQNQSVNFDFTKYKYITIACNNDSNFTSVKTIPTILLQDTAWNYYVGNSVHIEEAEYVLACTVNISKTRLLLYSTNCYNMTFTSINVYVHN